MMSCDRLSLIERYFEILTELNQLILETRELGKQNSFSLLQRELGEIQMHLDVFRSLPRLELKPDFQDSPPSSPCVLRGISITGVATLRTQFIQAVPCL